MKPEELEKIPLQVERLFYDLQKRVMEDIVRRIRKTGGITSTADYQIEKLIMMGQSSEFMESEIKRLTQMTDTEIYQLYEDVIDKEYTRNKAIYEQVNANFIPYEDSPEMQAWVSAVVAQTRGEIKNITQSMGFALKYGGKTVFTPFAEYYQKYLDRACMDIITGTFSYNTVLRRVVKEMTASGIRTVDYASGHSNRITVAARRAIMTGVNQLCGKINQMNAEKLGTDTYEVPWHAGARPSHWWGGMIFTMQELIDICGLGTGEGIGGWNCYHPYYAFIPGISVRQYTDEQLAELNAKEKIEREWHGKKYNTYAASQKQRQMETLMRKQRSDVKLLKDGKASRDEITIAQARYMKTLHEYQAFSKKMNLPEQMERVYMDGLGRIASGKKTYQKTIAKMERDVILKAKLKEAGLKGTIHTAPVKIDMNLLSFDNDHINNERAHGVTFEEAKRFITNAIISETVWKGKFERYYSLDGVAYVNKNNLQIRTAYKEQQFSKTVQQVMEVLKKYGR